MINITPVIANYKDFLRDRTKLYALLYDLYPTERRDRNILMSIYDMGIVDRIQNTNQISVPQMVVYAKIVEDAYGINRDLVLEGLSAWINALGISTEPTMESKVALTEKKAKVQEIIALLEMIKPIRANITITAGERERFFYEWLEKITNHSWMAKIRENQVSFELLALHASKLNGSLFDIIDPNMVEELLNWIKKTEFTPNSVAHCSLLLRYKQFLKTMNQGIDEEDNKAYLIESSQENEQYTYYDPLIDSIKNAGFEYVDTRYNSNDKLNCLLVIANIHYGPFFHEWEKKGVHFSFTLGTPASNDRPAWWTRTMTRKTRTKNLSENSIKEERRINVGIYQFGIDVPDTLYIKADAHESNVVFFWGIGSNPMNIRIDRSFTDQLYVCGHKGQYLILRASDNKNYSFTIKKG